MAVAAKNCKPLRKFVTIQPIKNYYNMERYFIYRVFDGKLHSYTYINVDPRVSLKWHKLICSDYDFFSSNDNKVLNISYNGWK